MQKPTKDCPHCGAQIASQAVMCPQCKASLVKKKNWLAKHPVVTVLLSLLVIAIGIGIVGAATGGKKTETEAPKQAENKPAQKTETAAAPAVASAPEPEKKDENTVKVGEPITVGAISWIVQTPQKMATISSTNEFIDPAQASGVFVLVPVTVEQVSGERGTLEPSMAKIVDSRGRTFDEINYMSASSFNVSMAMGAEKMLTYIQLNPNVPVSRTCVFDIAPDATGLKLEINSGGMTARYRGYVELGI